MRPEIITEIARYYESDLGYKIPPMTPLVGEDFNTTRAGIHADGLLKDPEVYAAFDTEALLGRQMRVMISQSSGAAGLLHWIESYYGLRGRHNLDKRDQRLARVNEWIQQQYVDGRVTAIGDEELANVIATLVPQLDAELRGVLVTD
jgi:isopropylmalate/homocitrate/citramalate synthase